MSDLPVLRTREGQNAKIAELEAEVERLKKEWVTLYGVERMRFAAVQRMSAEIERLRARISALEQALSQAGDSIELAEAEQRGYMRGLAENERLWAENMALKLAKKS